MIVHSDSDNPLAQIKLEDGTPYSTLACGPYLPLSFQGTLALGRELPVRQPANTDFAFEWPPVGDWLASQSVPAVGTIIDCTGTWPDCIVLTMRRFLPVKDLDAYFWSEQLIDDLAAWHRPPFPKPNIYLSILQTIWWHSLSTSEKGVVTHQLQRINIR
jgi:hypothetical protein